MSNERIGEIPLDDYLEIVGRGKGGGPGGGKPANRALKMVGLLLLCTLCMAAGDYIGPLSGKNVRTATYEEAIALLSDSRHEAWAGETGMVAAKLHAENILAAIHGLAMRQADHQNYASGYLRNISMTGIKLLQRLETDGVTPKKVTDDLQMIRKLLGN